MVNSRRRDWTHSKKVHEWGVIAHGRTVDGGMCGEYWHCPLCNRFSEQGVKPFWTVRQFAKVVSELQAQGIRVVPIGYDKVWQPPPPLPTARGRFDVSMCDDRWQIHDHRYGTTFSFGEGKRGEQRDGLRFVREYIRRHGDINLSSMPYRLEDPPHWNPGDRGEEMP